MKVRRLVKRFNVTPRRLLGMIIMLNIFPIIGVLLAMSEGTPLFDAYLLGFAFDALLSILFGVVMMTLNLLID